MTTEIGAMNRARGGATQESPPDLEVVIVSYHSRSHVEELLASWPATLAVALVDNSGGEDGLADVAANDDRARYLDAGGVGFARAANLGAFTSERAYVAFVNPDSRPSYDDLRALAEGLERDPVSASHAATVTGGEDDIEIGVGGWEPGTLRTIAYAAGLHKRWPRIGVYAKPARGERVPVQWTTGACMVVRTEQFRRLGGFDEAFFVYSEDMSFGRRARQAGLRQVLRPDVVVAHGAGNSGAPSGEMLRLRGASFANYVERYHPPAAARVMRGAMALGYLARAAQRRGLGEKDLAAQHLAVVRGLLTRRAYVGGAEVARARFDATAEATR